MLTRSCANRSVTLRRSERRCELAASADIYPAEADIRAAARHMIIAGTGVDGTVSTPMPAAPLTTVPLPLIPTQVQTPQESFPADPSAGQPSISSTPIAPPLLPPALITTPAPVLRRTLL